MVLRQITRHVREQNWFAVFIDFLVVVIGIFIGLQVTDWNQARLDRGLEARYLQAIQVDLDTTRTNLAAAREALGQSRDALLLLAAFDAGDAETLDATTIDQAVQSGLWDLNLLEVQLNAYEDLKSSVGTGVLGSAPLRIALSRLDSKLARLRMAENDMQALQYRNIDAYLAAHFPMRRFADLNYQTMGLPTVSAPSADDYLAWITHRDTQNRVAMKYFAVNNLLTRHSELADALGKLQGRVSARLAELTGDRPASEQTPGALLSE